MSKRQLLPGMCVFVVVGAFFLLVHKQGTGALFGDWNWINGVAVAAILLVLFGVAMKVDVDRAKQPKKNYNKPQIFIVSIGMAAGAITNSMCPWSMLPRLGLVAAVAVVASALAMFMGVLITKLRSPD